MTRRYNLVPLKPRRRQLRQDSTEVEQILWNEIRNRNLGHKFIRQYSIDRYVMDFYCPKARLGIEIEGGIHKTRKIYDSYRERYINAFWINILKFTNDEVENNLSEVIEKIKLRLNPLSLIKERGTKGVS